MEPNPKAEFSIVTRTSSKAWLPELIASAGPEVTETYIDFFTSTIRNRNTRLAYARACWQFFDWCRAHGLELTTVRPFHVAAWIEDFPGSKPTIKQKLAAVRMLYEFLVVCQIRAVGRVTEHNAELGITFRCLPDCVLRGRRQTCLNDGKHRITS